MYNSHVFRKQSLEAESAEERGRQKKKWLHKYHNSIRPALIEKYSRRINNFVVRVRFPSCS